MAVGYIKRVAGPFTGAGTVSLPFGFVVYKETDIYVALASSESATHTLEYGTDYTVTLNDDQETTPGGTVTLTTPLVDGEVVAVGSALEYNQPTQLTNFSRFPPEIINEALDRIVILIQQLVEKSSRAITTDITDTMSAGELKAKLLSSAEDAAKSAASAAGSASAAAASAGAASASEANAKESETNAAASESAAATSEANAKASENAAKSSETNAKASEEAAKASETKAGEYADSAEASATTASAKATEAAASEANAKASENAAKSSETNAKASETSASASKTAAATSAQEAKDAAAQAVAGQVNANWTETDTTSKAYIQNKPALKPVATSGSYNDLDNKPSPIQYVAQTLTTAQKTQARTNIDAVSESELKTALSELIVEYGGTVPTD